MAENTEPKVGARLRAIREQQGLSLRALVERCGLSINAISLIERGENSPTVSTLHRLATALNVPITDFFQVENRKKAVFVRQKMGLRSQSKGVTMESLGIGLSNQQIEPFLMTIDPGAGNITDPISHPGEEFIHCVEGEIEYCIENELYRLQKGDSLLFDASQSHAYHNPFQNPAIVLMVLQSTQDHRNVPQLHIE